MKRWEKIKINGEDFELDTKEIVTNPCVFYQSVYDVYGRCSEAKREIWEDWANWFRSCNSTMFGVTSYNCNFFTISGVVNRGDVSYYVVITKAHNRAWKIKWVNE